MIEGVPVKCVWFHVLANLNMKISFNVSGATITIIHDYVCRFFLISDEILHGRQWSKSPHLLLHRNTSQNHFNRGRRKIYKTFSASWLLKLFTRGSGKSRNRQSWLDVTDSALIILTIPDIHDIKMSDTMNFKWSDHWTHSTNRKAVNVDRNDRLIRIFNDH